MITAYENAATAGYAITRPVSERFPKLGFIYVVDRLM